MSWHFAFIIFLYGGGGTGWMRQPQLVIGLPKRERDILTLTLSGREAIPELLNILMQKGLQVYRLAPQEADLEEVYFALHGDAQ